MPAIPNQLRDEKYRFIRVGNKSKIPIDKNWTSDGNYKWNDSVIVDHLKKGGNYGFVTGNELIVVDCDNVSAADAVRENLPATFSVKTGGGGVHYYYKCPLQKKIPLNKDKVHYGEVQTNGQQVIGPTCLHEKGTTYEVIQDIPITAISEEELRAALAPFFEVEYDSKPKNGKKEENDLLLDKIKSTLKVTDVLGRYGIEGKAGKNCPCPLHPSRRGQCFSVRQDDMVWHCFDCEEKGNIFHLIMLHDKIDFNQAKEKAAGWAGLDIKKAEIEAKSNQYLLDVVNHTDSEEIHPSMDFKDGRFYMGFSSEIPRTEAVPGAKGDDKVKTWYPTILLASPTYGPLSEGLPFCLRSMCGTSFWDGNIEGLPLKLKSNSTISARPLAKTLQRSIPLIIGGDIPTLDYKGGGSHNPTEPTEERLLDIYNISISLYNIHKYLSVSASVSASVRLEAVRKIGSELFNLVLKSVKERVWYASEEAYELLALWIMGTYMYQVFDAYPYLTFMASKESGKTRSLSLVHALAWKAEMVVNPSEASFYTMIEAIRPTLCIDENSFAGKQNPTLRTLLLTSHKRGVTVPRADYDKNKGIRVLRHFSTYTPVALVDIEYIDDVIESRSLSIELKKKIVKLEKDADAGVNDEQFVNLRGMLLHYSLLVAPIVHQLYNEYKIEDKAITNRDSDNWRPVLTLAKLFSDDLENRMLAYAIKRTTEKHMDVNEEDRDTQLVHILFDNIVGDWDDKEKAYKGGQGEGEYEPADIETWFRIYLGDPRTKIVGSGAYEKEIERHIEHKWLNPEWVGKAVKRIKLTVKKKRTGRASYSRTKYFITPAAVIDIAERYRIVERRGDDRITDWGSE